MWKGLQGRDSTYAYVRSGTSKAEIAGETIENDRWWKVGEAKSEEVSKDAVLNDTTGVYMPGGGSLVHGYVSQSAEDDANKMYRMPSLLSVSLLFLCNTRKNMCMVKLICSSRFPQLGCHRAGQSIFQE